MSMDPNDPTRRIPPTAPRAEPAPVVAREEELVHAELADRLRSLRTAVTIVGVLALAALGVGLWALLTKEEEDDTRRGASPASVNRLDERVDDLESRLDERATKGSVSELRGSQEELGQQVDELAKQAEEGGDAAEAQQSVEELGADVARLQQRLDELEQRQEESGQAP